MSIFTATAASYLLVRAGADMFFPVVPVPASPLAQECRGEVHLQPLAFVLQQINTQARNGSLTMERMSLNRTRCTELAMLHAYSLAARSNFHSIEFSIYNRRELNSIAEQEVHGLARQLTRHAMIRHGFVAQWLAAAVQDDATDYPLLFTTVLLGAVAASVAAARS